jgi:hypothetical protein
MLCKHGVVRSCSVQKIFLLLLSRLNTLFLIYSINPFFDIYGLIPYSGVAKSAPLAATTLVNTPLAS